MKLNTIHVEITQKIIDSASRMSINRCPIALAINREIKGFDNKLEQASVHLEDGWVTNSIRGERGFDSHLYRFDLPAEAQSFVQKWTNKSEVAPFEFELPLKYDRKRTSCLNGTL